jgi:hypothetical protein
MKRACGIAYLSLICLTSSCGGNDSSPGAKPKPPTSDDPAFAISGLRNWYLIPDAVTAGQTTIDISIVAPAGTQTVDAWVGEQLSLRLTPSNGNFVGQISLAELAAGDFEVLFAADGSDTAFAKRVIHHSAPLYFLMATDWDFSEPGAYSLMIMNSMRTQHPTMRFTHFVGPYTYTDPALDPARRTAITTWVKDAQQKGDEIGLHIHPYCNFVTRANVTCVTDQSTVYATDATGYTIKVAAYDEPTFGKLLDAADALFIANGLGKPVTFRAGGWTADLTTVKALASHGYVADSSALNWARLEEWQHQGTGELYRWNMSHWLPMGDTSQPYYPSATDVLTPSANPLTILEVPDNGIMADYASLAEMTQIAQSNWNGQALTTAKTLMYGFHPSESLPLEYSDRIFKILNYAEEHMASKDKGPMVYAVLKDMPNVFKPN